MKLLNKSLLLLSLAFAISGCAILHHHQLGDVDSDVVKKGRKFEVLVSETGFNVGEAGNILKATTRSKQSRKDVSQVQSMIEMFQMGPRTGNPVFTDQFADNLVDMVLEKCPSGKVSGLSSTRETAKYPVVSGEIVKISGYCNDKTEE